MPEQQWISEGVFTVSEFFEPRECERYIELAESTGFDEAPINTLGGAQVIKEVRNNTRVMIDNPQWAEEIWERAKQFVPAHFGVWEAVGVNERFRFYRYDVGQQFDWHYDGAYERPNRERSRLTFMIYLNAGFEGGETLFDTTAVTPETGLALFFVHDLLHKGEAVKSGRKYVLRTDVMYRS